MISFGFWSEGDKSFVLSMHFIDYYSSVLFGGCAAIQVWKRYFSTNAM
jgi:hypothetical protein